MLIKQALFFDSPERSMTLYIIRRGKTNKIVHKKETRPDDHRRLIASILHQVCKP